MAGKRKPETSQKPLSNTGKLAKIILYIQYIERNVILLYSYIME